LSLYEGVGVGVLKIKESESELLCTNSTALGTIPTFFIKTLRKAMKNLSQESQSPALDLNLKPPECKAGVLPK
jgi:hypothetical protein